LVVWIEIEEQELGFEIDRGEESLIPRFCWN